MTKRDKQVATALKVLSALTEAHNLVERARQLRRAAAIICNVEQLAGNATGENDAQHKLQRARRNERQAKEDLMRTVVVLRIEIEGIGR